MTVKLLSKFTVLPVENSNNVDRLTFRICSEGFSYLYQEFVMKNSARFLAATFVSMVTCSAYSFNVCDLKSQEIQATGSSAQEILVYKAKLNKECDVYEKYVDAREKAQLLYDITLVDVNLYQSMRFVRRSDYQNSKYYNIPTEVTYQVLQSDYSKPNSEKSSIIWDNWIAGIKQLPIELEKIRAGADFTLAQLQNVHRGFFTLSDEQGDFAHQPDPGLLKPPFSNDGFWWKFATDADAQSAMKVIAEINAKYESMGLISNAKGADDIRYPLHVRAAAGGGYVLHSGDSRANPEHLTNLFKFMTTMMKQARHNTHLVWNNHLMTPGEVAFFAQKFYVEIHPFSEGNGRTSRFIQELILNFYDFPHGSSGDLMDIDVLTNHENYYQTAILKLSEEMDRMGQCMDSYAEQLRSNRRIKTVNEIDPMSLDYDCRLLPTRR